MKVILLTDVPKVGNKYDVKDLKEGYAQNVLLSKGLAVLATKQELAKLEAKQRQMKIKHEEEVKLFKELISLIDSKTIKIKSKANEKGVLFKSVSQSDVASSIKDLTGLDIDANSIIMDHIKSIGEHKVSIKKGENRGDCRIIVEAI